MSEQIERRAYKRFEAREGAFAALKGPISKLGQIIDISKGGLAFRYIHTGESVKKSFEMEIFSAGNGFRLKGIQCRTVSDFEIDNPFPFSSIKMRRLGAEFEDFNSNQESQLEYFIQNHTIGEA